MGKKEIQELRKRLHLTQQELADTLGLAAKGVVSRWERGDRIPGETILRLLRLLNALPNAEAQKLIAKLKNYASKNR